MLPQKKRLNISTFNLRKQEIKRVEDENFSLFYRDDKNFRCAVVVTKKVANTAVDRNRIRRLITEAVQDLKLEGEYLFKVKKNIANQKRDNVYILLQKLMSKIK